MAPKEAADLLPQVYAELRRIASLRLAGESHEHTLQPTALVHEAWLKLSGEHERPWRDRHHFLSAAAEAMRRILVDRARRRQAGKRGANAQRLDIEGLDLPIPDEDDRILAIHESLNRFAAVNPERAELVKLRYFGGLSFEEVAGVLGVSLPTAKRWWTYSRAWLLSDLASPN